jgi:hypothetical protein
MPPSAQGKKKQPFESRTGSYRFPLRGLDENKTALPLVGRASFLERMFFTPVRPYFGGD